MIHHEMSQEEKEKLVREVFRLAEKDCLKVLSQVKVPTADLGDMMVRAVWFYERRLKDNE